MSSNRHHRTILIVEHTKSTFKSTHMNTKGIYIVDNSNRSKYSSEYSILGEHYVACDMFRPTNEMVLFFFSLSYCVYFAW